MQDEAMRKLSDQKQMQEMKIVKDFMILTNQVLGAGTNGKVYVAINVKK